MFSQLGPLFKTTLRQAESSDSRMAIRRDERQDQEKGQEYEDKLEDENSLWEDTTTVSVEALKAFLVEFLKSKGEEQLASADNAKSPAAEIYQPKPLEPANPMAARAIKAYASHTLPEEPQPLPQPEQNAGNLVDLLRSDELRTIHQLITELEVLSRKGTTFLTIEKADSFLEALVRAVEIEKSRP